MLQIDQQGLDFISSFEGGRSSDGYFHSYWDPYGKVVTVGFGQTRINGHAVPMGLRWTLAQAEADLRISVDNDYLPAVAALGVPLNPNQVSALASFTYNLGSGSMSWDVGRYLRAREYRAAADALLNYDRAGGVRLAGLTRRRQAERALFLTPWTDPDPLRYRWLDTATHDLGGRKLIERQIVEEYDAKRKHPHLYPRRLRRLRDDLGLLAGRLENVIESDPQHRGEFHRQWRHGQLAGRAAGRRYA